MKQNVLPGRARYQMYLLSGTRGTIVVIEQERVAPEAAWFAASKSPYPNLNEDG